jgi:hypothetical protein
MHIITIYKKHPFRPTFALFGYDFYFHWGHNLKFLEVGKMHQPHITLRIIYHLGKLKIER